MRTSWGLLAVTMAFSCGSPPSPAAPTRAEPPAVSATDTIPSERLEWLEVYERAGFPDVQGHSRVELISPVRNGAQFAWQLDTSPPRYLRDQLWEVSDPCEAWQGAPVALGASQFDSIHQRGCQRLRLSAVPSEFLPELEARLLGAESQRKCARNVSQTPRGAPDAAWPALPALMPSGATTGSTNALTWTACAHWARQLGREDLAARALAAAAAQAETECRTPPCDILRRLEAEAQRVLVGSALLGLGATWMTREGVLELARRAVRVAPESDTPIATQARELAGRLEQELGRDEARRRASQVNPNGLEPRAQLALYADLLPDETGIGPQTPEYRCSKSSPTAALIRLGPDSVPALIERVEDDRLTRTVRATPGSLLPIASVGDVALSALERVAVRRFDRKRAREAVLAWWNSAQHQSFADFAAAALRVANETERVALARELGERDPNRMVLELGTLTHATQDARVRARLVELLEAGELTAAFARGQCASPATVDPPPSSTLRWFPESVLWKTMQRLSRDRILLPPLERRAMFRVLLQSIHDSSPEVRVAAADALLSWGRYEGVQPVSRYAATLDSGAGSAAQRARVIRVLMRSGKGQAITIASRLVDPEQPRTLGAAAHGLSQALVLARNHGGNFQIPDATQRDLSRVAAQALRAKLIRLGGQYATGAALDSSAEWLLDIVTSGRGYSPPRYQTPFEQHQAVLESLNSQLRAQGQQVLSIPIAEAPPSAAGLGETTWTTAAQIVKSELDGFGAGAEWLDSWRGAIVRPTELLPALGALARANPGFALRLRMIRHAGNRGVSLELAAQATGDPLASVHAACFGPDPCPSFAHEGIAMRAIDSRLAWFASEVSKRWADHRDQTLDVVVGVAVPPTGGRDCDG